MALVFYNLKLVWSLKKPHESHATRSDQEVLFPNASTRSCSFYCSRQEAFFRTHRRQVEIKKKSQSRLIFSNCTTHYAGNTYEEEKEEEIAKVTLIWRAIKLPIYSVALVPLTVGGAAAYLHTGMFLARRYFVLLASSILVITWLNLSNDVYDFDTGADKNKKESVVNLVGRNLCCCLLLTCPWPHWADMDISRGRQCASNIIASFCNYLWLHISGTENLASLECPPFRLSYQGLGEPLCFSAFGPFATTAFYMLLGTSSEMTRRLPLTGTILSASLLVGFTTSLILFCSHFHQIEGDVAVGKISPLVRLGTERGSYVVKVAILTLYSLLFAFGLSRALPFTCILFCALTIPMGKLVVSFVEENHKEKGKIFMAKYYCVRLHTLFGAALAAGLVAARLISGR